MSNLATPEKSVVVYALYRGDEFLDMGTTEELSEKYDVKPETVRFLASPSHHKRAGNTRMLAERIEVSWWKM